MKSKPLLLLILTLVMVSCYRGDKKELAFIQITDRNGFSETISSPDRLQKFSEVDFLSNQSYKQVLRLFGKNNKGQALGKITSYHPNGQVFQYLEVANARAYGLYKEWYPNGQLKIDAMVIGGPADLNAENDWLFDGACKVFNEKGSLVSQMNYVKGSLEGESTYYYDNGAVWRKVTYFSNELKGDALEYYPNGTLYCRTHFDHGKKNGTSIALWGENKLTFVEEYQDNLLISGKYFDKAGNFVAEIQEGSGQRAVFENESLAQLVNYKSGFVEGEVQEFTKEGEVKRIYFLKENEKVGEECEYYLKHENLSGEEKQKKLSFYWENGLINGSVKSWYPNGKLESQKEIKRNKKEGMNCAWYLNGKTMLVEEYENDALLNGKYYKNDGGEAVSSIVNGNGTATLFDKEGGFLNRIKYSKGRPVEE